MRIASDSLQNSASKCQIFRCDPTVRLDVTPQCVPTVRSTRSRVTKLMWWHLAARNRTISAAITTIRLTALARLADVRSWTEREKGSAARLEHGRGEHHVTVIVTVAMLDSARPSVSL
jgi:hypothetical protein